MSRRPCLFKETDISRAFRAARAAGITACVEISRDGTLRITQLPTNSPPLADAEKSPFDAWKDERNARSA
jgi:hypothetical protein